MKYNYIQIGNRIRSEREKLNLSQEKLLENIREKRKPCIGRNTLSKIENGDTKSFNAISLAQLTSLCEEFNCSISYLFGEYEYRNYDNKFICEKTDIAEKNLVKILGHKNDFLNALISSKYFYEMDFSFDQMAQALQKINQCISDLKYLEEKSALLPKNSTQYHEINQTYFNIVSASEKWESRIIYNIYKMGIDFGNTMENVKNSAIKETLDTNSD